LTHECHPNAVVRQEAPDITERAAFVWVIRHWVIGTLIRHSSFEFRTVTGALSFEFLR
jgi:hypothetical protein